MNERVLKEAGRAKLVLAALLIVGTMVAEALAFGIALLLGLPDDSLWSEIVLELSGAVAAVLGVIALGGRRWASVSRDDVAFTFRFGWWCLALSVGLMGLDLWDCLASAMPVSPEWPSRVIELTLFTLSIGIYEEFLFRGLVFNGLLAVMGGTHRGVWRAVILTSLLFGLAHVDFGTDFAEPAMVAQAILKVLQTGIYSVMLCVIVLRTRRLGGVSLYHGLDDLLILLPSVALFAEPLDTEYVLAGEEGLSAIWFYLVIIVLYMPFLIKSVRELRRGQDVYRGVFMERLVARLEREAQRPWDDGPSPWSPPAPGVVADLAASRAVETGSTPPAAPDARPGPAPTAPAADFPAGWTETPAQAPPATGSQPRPDRSGRPPAPKGL